MTLVSLSACSDATADYCASLGEEQPTLRQLSAGEVEEDSVTEAAAVFERLSDAAPEDLRDEWTTFVNAWQGLADALKSGGDTNEAAERAVRGAGDKLRSQPVLDAAAGIEQHADDVCGVDLGGAAP